MSKPDASRTLRFELNRLDLADMTVKPHTIKIVGPAPTPDIAGLCKKLRKPLNYALHLYQCDVDTTSADTLERQAAEIERLREGLNGAKHELKLVIRDIDAALIGEDHD